MAFYNYQWNAEKQKKTAEKQLIKYTKKIISKYSPFYREWFKKNGIDDKNIQTIEDFQRIPPITKIEHMKQPQAFILNPKEPLWWESQFNTEPISGLQSMRYWLKSWGKTYLKSIFSKDSISANEKIIIEASKEWLPLHFHSTEGSHEPALIAYSHRDIMKNVSEIIAHLYLTGFKANWEVFNAMPASPSVNFFQSIWTPLFVGGGTFFSCSDKHIPIDNQISLTNNITFEVFLSTPSYAMKWLSTALKKLDNHEIKPIKSFKLCILAGEPLSQAVRNDIKKSFKRLGSNPWIIESYSNNRTKVVFFECQEGSGIHLNPRYFYWEVLDKKTFEPLEEGATGYLCFSHIDWRGTSFIRFNTGDIVEGLTWEKCDNCNLTFPKIKGVIKSSNL